MKKLDLFIPVENQVRELDAKLLLACLAVQRGFLVYLGWKGEMDQKIYRFRPGIYFAKSFARQNQKMLRILKGLGFRVIAWDEEGLVHYPPHVYHQVRFSADVIPYIDHIIAWGDDSAKLLTIHQPNVSIPIHVLGNPRGDLLRPELRDYFQEETRDLKKQHGDFILVNTNFGTVNCFDPSLNICLPDDQSPRKIVLGRVARNMPQEFAYLRYSERLRLLQNFQELLPQLATHFPKHTIILRPHPSENHSVWHDCAKNFPNVFVTNQGNALPWILASAVMIHNGCTTAVEAVSMDQPAISYEPFQSMDETNYLPNQLSHRCSTIDEIVQTIQNYVTKPSQSWRKHDNTELFNNFLAAQDGAFASESLLHLVEKVEADFTTTSTSAGKRISTMFAAAIRHGSKRFKRFQGNLRYSKIFQDQRFPPLSIPDLQNRATRFSQLLKFSLPIHIKPITKTIVKLHQ
ncbi:MAG: hypothetical protein NPIRA04_00540 [Nitrospirales bacterium]|nr:MAG: hypothetical protein NPIRA04_00540 [Nitrospirales bacterium]